MGGIHCTVHSVDNPLYCSQCGQSIVLFTVWTIPTTAVSIWNTGIVVTKPRVNTDWKFFPNLKIQAHTGYKMYTTNRNNWQYYRQIFHNLNLNTIYWTVLFIKRFMNRFYYKCLIINTFPPYQTRASTIVICVMQFWPPDDEHMCSKHVETWN